MSLAVIRELSNRYGADPSYVLAGGGNSSFKDEQYLYIKPSGVPLAKIVEDDFIKLERAVIRRAFADVAKAPAAEREKLANRYMTFATVNSSGRRPSVEAPLHELLEFTYVLHLHPGVVNALTCGQDGEKICNELFPGALWVPATDPGFILGLTLLEHLENYKRQNGHAPALIFLQNHGVFAGADTAEGIDAIYKQVMDTLRECCAQAGISLEVELTGEYDMDTVMEYAPQLRWWLSDGTAPMTVKSIAPFKTACGALTPDHIVYAKSYSLVCDAPSREAVEAFEKLHGYKPLVVEVPGKAVFCAGKNAPAAETVAMLARDGGLVQQLSSAFGGPLYLDDARRAFIENWEAESYRRKVAAGSGATLTGKIAVVTGGAQGFGFGIAEKLAAAGATVVIADLNADGARQAAAAIKSTGGTGAVAVNISDEASVETMVRAVASNYGGIDLFVANAGVLKAGSVKTLEKKDWDFVTSINYSGYFVCVKFVSRLMAKQNSAGPGW
ncbi:MAG: SDR family NAD(P)-dependent oxidoreductase, partial [Victivallaceae bacterium]|nr:SDR family NAD(P)-dependent oxidoreductase [Victivallaceae bacterium]